MPICYKQKLMRVQFSSKQVQHFTTTFFTKPAIIFKYTRANNKPITVIVLLQSCCSEVLFLFKVGQL